MRKKVIVIGAGLSGLMCAVILQDTYDVLVLEARERLGGRIYTIDGHDLGPSWIWPHQTMIRDLIGHLGLHTVEQYTTGEALYDAPHGVERFTTPQTPRSYRIQGGISRVVEALAGQLKHPVKLQTSVQTVAYQEQMLEVSTEREKYQADRVIVAMPPRVAIKHIHYVPALSPSQIHTLSTVPTWMGYASKCVIVYETPFWREGGFSGFGISHLGPLGEIHDACTSESAALFGFMRTTEEKCDIEERVIAQLIRMYGSKAASPVAIHMVDWQQESYSAVPEDVKVPSSHPRYGFTMHHFDGRVLFTGSESAYREGGYLEGALYAAMETVKQIKP